MVISTKRKTYSKRFIMTFSIDADGERLGEGEKPS